MAIYYFNPPGSCKDCVDGPAPAIHPFFTAGSGCAAAVLPAWIWDILDFPRVAYSLDPGQAPGYGQVVVQNMLHKLEQYYYEARGNKWYGYFTVFCRWTLAIAWVISGVVKIRGERFAAGLSHNHPLGQYFDALLNTGYYYTFIGVSQLIVAILLLIPRTALLGAISSFPIILNICVLAYSVRFEGTRIATFILLANLFLLCWDYNRLKSILPFKQIKLDANSTNDKRINNRFPYVFFGSVLATLAMVVFLNNIMYDIRPGNEPAECWNGCPGNSNPKACEEFCDCIHNRGQPLKKCLEDYEKAKDS